MTIQRILNAALGAPKKHNPKRAVKSLVARNFHTDGNLFIEAYDYLNAFDPMQNRNFRAKAIVNLAMSIECSLKSLIISLSQDSETPISAYNIARNHSHKIEKLHSEVESRSKQRFKINKRNDTIFNDLKSLKVESRYSFEIWLLRTQAVKGKFFLGEDLVSRTIDSAAWALLVRNEAVMLNDLAKKCHSKYLSKHAILSGKKFSTYEIELKKFTDALPKR